MTSWFLLNMLYRRKNTILYSFYFCCSNFRIKFFRWLSFSLCQRRWIKLKIQPDRQDKISIKTIAITNSKNSLLTICYHYFRQHKENLAFNQILLKILRKVLKQILGIKLYIFVTFNSIHMMEPTGEMQVPVQKKLLNT